LNHVFAVVSDPDAVFASESGCAECRMNFRAFLISLPFRTLETALIVAGIATKTASIIRSHWSVIYEPALTIRFAFLSWAIRICRTFFIMRLSVALSAALNFAFAMSQL